VPSGRIERIEHACSSLLGAVPPVMLDGLPRGSLMGVLNPTPPEDMVDREGRPYFLWDVDMTLDRFRELLADDNLEVRAYLVGKLMRQARPDDVFTFVTVAEIEALWPRLERYLGRTRKFWTWILAEWRKDSGEKLAKPSNR
jgi:hypothetical protein